MKNIQKTIGFINLGCDKNRIDLEYIINDFIKAGFTPVPEQEAQIIIVNTCGFIANARKEAIDTILNTARYRVTKSQYGGGKSSFTKDGVLEKLVVTGCLTGCEEFERIKALLPEVDLFVKLNEQEDIVDRVCALFKTDIPQLKTDLQHAINDNFNIKNEATEQPSPCSRTRERTLTTPSSIAYLRICDGCNNFCSYCRIPLIRGRFVSRLPADIIAEAKKLVASGVREIILVGQDTTAYGKDLKNKTNLSSLLKELEKIKDLKWIRLLYCYPENVTSDLIKTIKASEKICKYIDIPLQHINNKILKTMNRRINKEQIIKLLNLLQKEIENVALRTTFIVGFPGETRAQFKELKNFVKSTNFAYVGVFAYSKEEGTAASHMSGQIRERVKRRRKRALERVAQIANARFLSRLLDKTFVAINDGKVSDGLYEFRTELAAPEVDTPVYIIDESERKTGEFYKIKITETDGNLISGVIINE